MCDPGSLALTLASTAVSGLGSYMQAKDQAANQASMIQARNNAYLENSRQQDQIQANASNIRNQTVDKFSPQAQQAQLQGAQQNREDAATGLIAGTPVIAPDVTPGAPQIVRDAYAKSAANAQNKALQTGQAQGKLEGYGDSNFMNSLITNNAQNKLQPLVEEGQHNAQMLPVQMESAANNAYKPPGALGPILQAVGSAGAYYGGKGLAAGPTPPPRPNIIWNTPAIG